MRLPSGHWCRALVFLPQRESCFLRISTHLALHKGAVQNVASPLVGRRLGTGVGHWCRALVFLPQRESCFLRISTHLALHKGAVQNVASPPVGRRLGTGVGHWCPLPYYKCRCYLHTPSPPGTQLSASVSSAFHALDTSAHKLLSPNGYGVVGLALSP